MADTPPSSRPGDGPPPGRGSDHDPARSSAGGRSRSHQRNFPPRLRRIEAAGGPVVPHQSFTGDDGYFACSSGVVLHPAGIGEPGDQGVFHSRRTTTAAYRQSLHQRYRRAAGRAARPSVGGNRRERSAHASVQRLLSRQPTRSRHHPQRRAPWYRGWDSMLRGGAEFSAGTGAPGLGRSTNRRERPACLP
jgi:hypothetical protein